MTLSSSGSQGESTPEPKTYSEEVCHENGLSYSLSDSDTEHLSSSLEAEHRLVPTAPRWHTHVSIARARCLRYLFLDRLLKSMGWQEYPENDDNFLPLTEDELREFQTKTEQVISGTNRHLPIVGFNEWAGPNPLLFLSPAEEEWHAEERGSTEAAGCHPPLHPLEECGRGQRGGGGLRVRNQ